MKTESYWGKFVAVIGAVLLITVILLTVIFLLSQLPTAAFPIAMVVAGSAALAAMWHWS